MPSHMDRLRATGAFPTILEILDQQEPAMPDDNLVLVFDTETTGLPIFHSPSDDPAQPHVAELAMILCRGDGEVVDTYSEIINIGVPMPAEAGRVNGITDEMIAKGIPPAQMWADFERFVERASLVVGHVVSFDLRMMRIQGARLAGKKWECPKPSFCTQYAAGRLMGVTKPKLTAAYQHFMGKPMEGAHRAMADVEATLQVYLRVADSQQPKPPRDPATRPTFDAPAAASETTIEQPPEAKGSVLGDNATPPFETIKSEIDDLYAEARNWLDGEPIANEEQAAAIAKLRDMIRDAGKRAEAMRVEEKRPFDEGAKAVQERYNPLVQKDRGKVDLALKACNSAMAPYLRAKEDAQRAEAQRLQNEALAAARAAQAAAQEAANSSDLNKREEAEKLLGDAKDLLGTAKRADAAKPQITGGGGRAVGLKSVWRAELADPAAAIAYFRENRPAALKEWMLEQAQAEVRAGKRELPGFIIHEDRVPV